MRVRPTSPACVLLIAALACERASSAAPGAPKDVIPVEHTTAHAYYQERCAQCHGERLEGNAYGPALAPLTQLPGDTLPRLLALVTAKGLPPRPGTPWITQGMPPTGTLEEPRLAALLAYLRWRAHPPPPSPDAGARPATP